MDEVDKEMAIALLYLLIAGFIWIMGFVMAWKNPSSPDSYIPLIIFCIMISLFGFLL